MKKLLSIILALTFVLSCAVVSFAAEKGDIDGDGVVTLFDVKAALYASTNRLTLTPEQKLAANIDNSQDGKITTEDARKILRLAGGMNAE